MSAPFIAEIRIFPYTFAPRTWAFCQGQTLSISQSTTLFALIGITYGGDGRTTFKLPDLQGRVPVGIGQGRGLSNYVLGQVGGTTTETLTQANMGTHNHPLQAAADQATTQLPSLTYYATGNWVDGSTSRAVSSYNPTAPNTALRSDAIANAGGGGSHNNMMPYQALNFCIALQGVFPQRP